MRGAAYPGVSYPRATSPCIVQLIRGPLGTTSSLFLQQWTTMRSQLQSRRGKVPLTLRWLGTPQGLRRCIYAKYLIFSQSWVFPTSHRPEHPPPGLSLLALPCHGARKDEPPFTDSFFDALSTCHLEGLRIREGGVVSTKSALEANDSQKGFVLSRSKQRKVFHSEGPCHTPGQQGLSHLGLQLSVQSTSTTFFHRYSQVLVLLCLSPCFVMDLHDSHLSNLKTGTRISTPFGPLTGTLRIVPREKLPGAA